MLKKRTLIIFILSALLVGGFVAFGQNKNSHKNLNQNEIIVDENFQVENSDDKNLLIEKYFQENPVTENPLNKDSADQKLLSKIDQLFIIGFRGYTLANAPDAKRALKETNLGGVILFDYDTPTKKYVRNIQSADQVKKLISDLQASSKTPLFIAVDEEGGKVSRLKNISGFIKSLSAETLGTQSNSAVFLAGENLGKQLKNFGFNLNFAPVLDVNVNSKNPVIGAIGRSFSADPAIVGEKGIAFMNGLLKNKIIPVGKHFPGHGSSTADSHLGFVDITKTYQDYELEPFKLACAGGIPAIMIAHVYNKNVDSVYPATLSKKHIDILKNEVDCKNQLVISDDMDMRAISALYKRKDAIVLALSAGVDVLIISNNITNYDSESFFKARQIVLTAVKNGEISEQRINEAYEKVVLVKQNFGF